MVRCCAVLIVALKGLTLELRLGVNKSAQLFLNKFCSELSGPFHDFLDMEWVQNATITSPVGAPEVLRHDVKHIRIFFKLAKFYANVTKRIQNKYCCNSSENVYVS